MTEREIFEAALQIEDAEARATLHCFADDRLTRPRMAGKPGDSPNDLQFAYTATY